MIDVIWQFLDTDIFVRICDLLLDEILVIWQQPGFDSKMSLRSVQESVLVDELFVLLFAVDLENTPIVWDSISGSHEVSSFDHLMVWHGKKDLDLVDDLLSGNIKWDL